MLINDNPVLKSQVKAHWESETCGTRYGYDSDRKLYFDQISAARYRLEPYILSFADFPRAKGKQVLEIGVGAGADFENWCQYVTHVTGIDLTEAAIQLTSERLALSAISPQKYTLHTADAENLPFDDRSFDLVYSWGVLHHTPNTTRAFQEVFRVLRPGGSLKAMIYHVPSWTGFMLYLQHGLLRGQFGKTQKEVMFTSLESPGTKAYTTREAVQFLTAIGFSNAQVSTKLGPGDLLTIKASEKYQTPLFKILWRLYPRWLVPLLGDRYGLNLLINATRPMSP